MSVSISGLFRSAAPGVFVGLAALGGQWSSSLARLALLSSPLVHIGLLVLATRLARRLPGRLPDTGQLVGIATVLAAEVLLGALVFGVPRWIKARASPAISAIEHWKQEHGQYPDVDASDGAFPDSLRAALYATGCLLYAPRATAYELTCSGIAFTKCTYDASLGDWRAWD